MLGPLEQGPVFVVLIMHIVAIVMIKLCVSDTVHA